MVGITFNSIYMFMKAKLKYKKQNTKNKTKQNKTKKKQNKTKQANKHGARCFG